MNKKSVRRMLSILLGLMFLVSLCGCIPNAYSREEGEQAEKELKGYVEEWLDQNVPGAYINSCEVESSYITSGAAFGNGLTDIITGAYSVSGKSHEFLYVRSSDAMYTQDLYDEAENIVRDLFFYGLGFSKEDLIISDVYRVEVDIQHKIYYDADEDGKLESEPSHGYFIYLPSALKQEDLDNYILDGLSSKKVIVGGLDFELNGDIEPEDIKLEVLRLYPGFGTIKIKTDNADYCIMISQEDIDGKTKDVISIEKKTISNATKTDATAQSAQKAYNSHYYIYDLESLHFIKDYGD
ncbi:MAG: hypothetical protein IKS48_14165 [Eubacterium sp.]|nr:hypothetical protein [Eubacterium sp.]